MAGRHIFAVIVVIGLSADFTRGFWDDLPTVCYKKNSDQFPKIGDKEFSCNPPFSPCNTCSDCSCDKQGNLIAGGACTLIGCFPYFSSCDKFEEFIALNPFLDINLNDPFGCYDGCNYWTECRCGYGKKLIPGGRCTDRTCH